MNELARRVQDLPAELFVKIYDYTFTAESGPLRINSDWKPSHLLHVSQKSRATFARSYYGSGRSIEIRTEQLLVDLDDLRLPYISTIPEYHLSLIAEIWYTMPRSEVWRSQHTFVKMELTKQVFEHAGLKSVLLLTDSDEDWEHLGWMNVSDQAWFNRRYPKLRMNASGD